MSDHYEIVIPVAENRAHLPPEGYHTFYLNQLEMGLRFPVPRFIQTLCDHFKVSPSQLTPNSYSSLLALGARVWVYQGEPDVSQGLDESIFLTNLPQSTEKRRVLETPVGARHKCQTGNSLKHPIYYYHRGLFSNFAPELDLPVINSASDQAITKALATNFMQALVWVGELSRRVSNAREVARSSKQSLDEILVQHDKLMRELEDVHGASDAEKISLDDKLTISKASEEMKKMKGEVEATWEKRKDDFLKSSEFDRLCSAKALSFFEKGFNGCLAQFRDNGYLDTEHPTSFLSILKALEDFPEEGEVESSFAPKE
ncbi:hypothetical protein F511_20566 [Dorcoceras hygrometricum]|uniref:Uncharacterized protein n=1 Tax=Dorcoceras hygrometricum TaxID=472368 RepID=A0A2Z7CWD9_9LAMI|nr:hypothetical protein F511_20566 [Dorcoceras hygrometricum]